MLLANLEVCRIGECGGVGGGVGRLLVIVGRGMREGEIGCFGREAISAHDIGFRGVVGREAGGEAGEEAGGEAGGVGGEGGAGGACFFV